MAEAVGASAPQTIAWLALEEGTEPPYSGGKTPPWMEAGGSSGEHTPTEDKLLETGWM